MGSDRNYILVRRLSPYVDSTQTVVIPARHQVNVPISIVWADRRTLALAATLEVKTLCSGVFTGRTLIDSNSLYTVVPVLNLRDKPFKVTEGYFFGVVEPITEVVSEASADVGMDEQQLEDTDVTEPKSSVLNFDSTKMRKKMKKIRALVKRNLVPVCSLSKE